jgi:hypothetical protein
MVLLFCIMVFSLLALLPSALQVVAPARADELVAACGVSDAGGVNRVFVGYSTFGIGYVDYCGQAQQSLQLASDPNNTVASGQSAGWVATAPAGLEVASASVRSMQQFEMTGGWVANFFWANGGGQSVGSSATSYSVGGLYPSSIFGFDLECDSGTTCPRTAAGFLVDDIDLDVVEIVPPALVFNSSSLWWEGSVGDASGVRWVRGTWPLGFSASAPSGIESMSATVNGTPAGGPQQPGCWGSGPSGAPNHTVWQQCDNSLNWTPTVTLSGAGDQQLDLSATSAALNPSISGVETIHVDTQVPTVTLSGPTQASSTQGTQYVTATASVGPSGLGSISCSTDGGPAQSYSTSPASIPVSGVGVHSIQCTASNRSYNPWGQVAVSTPATWSLDIAQPTVSGVSFSNIIHGLKCKPVRERVRVAARWVAVRRHGKLVKVHRRAHTKVVKAVRCHPRIVRRKVTVVLREKKHGRTVLVKRKKVERVVMPPQVVSQPKKRVAFGKGATVSGFLGMGSGTALGGRTVAVLTAPNNGLGQWTLAAVVTTNADGGWSATLPAGPSRLVEAAYGGDSTTEPSTSSTIELIVPAKVKLRVHPRRVRWGGTIRISGRVFGAHIPAGKLLRLRIGVAGVHETVGIPNIRRNGRFHTTWKFAAGSGVVRYWFSISTLNEADYPYAPGSSRRVYVTVGPG